MDVEAAQRELEETNDHATKAALREKIGDLESEAGVYLGVADKHHFAAQQLRTRCEEATPTPAPAHDR